VPVSELLMEGVRLMLLGMGIVFTFLIVLVFALYGMSRAAGAIERRQGAAPLPAAAEGTPHPVDHAINGELIAVIGAAVARYRSTRH
jgi:oxaloacetate decarboxylase gamma subunit